MNSAIVANSPLEVALSRLEDVRQRGNEYTARCPAHHDEKPSLSLREAEDGRLLVYCHVGCSATDIMSALGLRNRDMFATPAQKPSRADKPAIVATYPYSDEAGTLLYEVLRYEPKRFAQRRPDGVGGWVWNLHGVQRVPLRLDRLARLDDNHADPILWPEGEKDVLVAERMGFVATTTPQGAGNFRPEYVADHADVLYGREIAVIPDNDEPGRAYARQVAQALVQIACPVRIVELPGLPEHGDLSDWVAAGGDAGTLRDFIAATPLWKPAPVTLVTDVTLPRGRGEDTSQDEDEEAVTEVTQVTLPGNRGAQAPTETGSAVLNDVEAFIGRFVAYPSEHARVAHTLWIAHTHLMSAWESTPRLAFLSPEPGSGKSRALEVTELLVPNPLSTMNVTPAYLFRRIGNPDATPTVLFDEVDATFGPKARENEDLRSLLNAGHRRGAVAGRCVPRGKAMEPEDFPAYAAVAMAGLGDLPDTLLSRSVIVRMRRRSPFEQVEPFRRRKAEPEGHALRDRLTTWAAVIEPIVDVDDVVLPAGIEDRPADVWEALLAVADAAGGDWPQRARAAAVALVYEAQASTPSLNVRLLRDIRAEFDATGVDRLTPTQLVDALVALPEAPWAEVAQGGKPLNSRNLADRLKGYGIESRLTGGGSRNQRAYVRADFTDAWARYLAPEQGT